VFRSEALRNAPKYEGFVGKTKQRPRLPLPAKDGTEKAEETSFGNPRGKEKG